MPPVKRGEVWWVRFDLSIGGEVKKTRPAVIVSDQEADGVLARERPGPIRLGSGCVVENAVIIEVPFERERIIPGIGGRTQQLDRGMRLTEILKHAAEFSIT